jgi:predicted RND superfamily exporter protein
MPEYLEKRDRWGNSFALWALFAMLLFVPWAAWSLRSMQLQNEVHQWIPHGDPQWKAYEFAERHFSTEDGILVTWDGSRLDDPRLDRLTRRIRGTFDSHGRRRGGSPYFSAVKTPYDLIHQIHSTKIPIEQAIERVTGILVGRGPVRVRLTEEGRTRRDRLTRTLTELAHEQLGLQITIDPATAPLAEDLLADEDPALSSEVPAANEPSDEAGPEVASADSEVTSGSGDELEVEDAPGATRRESSLAELASVLPPVEPHDLVISWPGQHWQPEQVEAFSKLVLSLDSLGSVIGPATGETPITPVVEACFQVPGTPAAIAVYLSEAGQAEREQALGWLKQAAVDTGIPPQSLHLAGSPVAGNDLNAEVLKATWNPSAPWTRPHEKSLFLMSGLVGAAFALWMLRSWRLAMVVLGVSVYTAIVSLALVPASRTPMNMVLVTMPTLLLVTTLSVAVHIANYWRHAAAADSRTAVATSIRTAYSPVLWAGITSIIGQASLCTSSLSPIRQFGIFSSIGTAISLLITLVGLPALMLLFPAPVPDEEELDSSFWHSLAAWVARHQHLVNATCLATALVCSYGLRWFQSETKVVRYFGENTRTFQDYAAIEDRLGGVVPVDVIVRFDKEAQAELKFLQRRELIRTIENQIRQLPDVSGVLSLSDFLPDYQPPAENSGATRKRQQQRYAATSRVVESRVKSGRYPGAEELLSVCEEAGELNAEGDELWRVTAQVAALSPMSYGDFQKQLDALCSQVLASASGASQEKLPAIPANTARQYRPYASHLVTGLVPLFFATQEQLLTSFIASFAGAFLSIALVVMFVLRHPIAGFLAMIPNVLPIISVFGVISWLQIPIDLGSTVTASIALGITIDGTLHLVTWFQQGIRQGKNRAEAVAQALGHCGPAMWQTTLIVSCGLIVMAPCDLVLISRFGWLMAVLLAAASISDLVLTPALLAGPLGYLIEKCTPRNELADPESEVLPTTATTLKPEAEHTPPPAPHIDKRRIRISRPDT